jgi:hypothetical protein
MIVGHEKEITLCSAARCGFSFLKGLIFHPGDWVPGNAKKGGFLRGMFHRAAFIESLFWARLAECLG